MAVIWALAPIAARRASPSRSRVPDAEQVEDRVVGHDADQQRRHHRLDVPAGGDPARVGDGADRADVDRVGHRDRRRAPPAARRPSGTPAATTSTISASVIPTTSGSQSLIVSICSCRATDDPGQVGARAARDRRRGDVVARRARVWRLIGRAPVEREVGDHRRRPAARGARRDAAGAGERHGRGDLLEAGHALAAHVQREAPEGHLLGGAEARRAGSPPPGCARSAARRRSPPSAASAASGAASSGSGSASCCPESPGRAA